MRRRRKILERRGHIADTVEGSAFINLQLQTFLYSDEVPSAMSAPSLAFYPDVTLNSIAPLCADVLSPRTLAHSVPLLVTKFIAQYLSRFFFKRGFKTREQIVLPRIPF